MYKRERERVKERKREEVRIRKKEIAQYKMKPKAISLCYIQKRIHT